MNFKASYAKMQIIFISLHLESHPCAPMTLMSFRGLLSEGIQEFGVTEVKELLLDWLFSFLTVEWKDSLLGWHLSMRAAS